MINQFFNFGFLFSYLFYTAGVQERIDKGGKLLNTTKSLKMVQNEIRK
jgi:hypothetical protein